MEAEILLCAFENEDNIKKNEIYSSKKCNISFGIKANENFINFFKAKREMSNIVVKRIA